MNCTRALICAVAALCLPSQPALAVLVPQGTYFTDTATGLDWLQVTQTQGLSYNDVELLLAPGGSLEGWRRATREEFSALLHNIGVPYAPDGGNRAPDFNEDYGDLEIAEIVQAIVLLGDTYEVWLDENSPGITTDVGYTFGMLAERGFSTIDTAMVRDADLINTSGDPFSIHSDAAVTDCDPQGVGLTTRCQDGSGGGSDGADVFRTARHGKLGTYLVRDTSYVIPGEICDNGIDDDFDTYVDGDDTQCGGSPPEPVGLQVRCLHEPIYPEDGERIRLYAWAIDENGDNVVADSVEIVRSTVDNVVTTSVGQALAQIYYTPDRRLSYGCRATRGNERAVSWPSDGLLRLVDVGVPEKAIVDEYDSVPVFVNGRVKDALDIVFLHEKDQYDNYFDPEFVDHVTDLVMDGIFAIPWFVENQSTFNIWIGTSKDAEAKPGDTPSDWCDKKRPSKFSKKYGFAGAVGIVHRGGDFACRAKAGTKVFTIGHDPLRLQVIAHELGHALFFLSDEYCGATTGSGKCKGFRFTSLPHPIFGFVPPFPNLYPSESSCRGQASNDGYDPDACRNLNSAQVGFNFWLREPDYEPGPQLDEVPDLMQQTGGKPTRDGVTVDFYGVGDSERERMNWVVGNCAAGSC